MGKCNPNSATFTGIQGDCGDIDIHCVPITTGQPTFTPEVDDIPIAVDITENCVWFYLCTSEVWYQFCGGSICDFQELNQTIPGDPCSEISIPITFDDNGVCQERLIQLGDLATQLQQCLVLSEFSICALPQLTEAQVDNATSITLGACVDGSDVRIPYIEPVLIQGTPMKNALCYDINDTFNAGIKLADSRNLQFHLPYPAPILSFTNPTNQQGVLTVDAGLWASRFRLIPNLGASVLFMVGKKVDTDLFVFDESLDNGISNIGYMNDNVSYDIKEYPTERTYEFWGNYHVGIFPTDIFNVEVASDLVHTFILEPGETIEIEAVIAIGFERNILTTEQENGFMGYNVRYTFQGHNRVN